MATVLSHKIKLKPTIEQMQQLDHTINCCRFAYNWGLDKWKQLYSEGLKPNSRKVRNEFNKIKKSYSFLDGISAMPLNESFRQLGNAYKMFFIGQNKYPKFKSKRNFTQSFSISNHFNYKEDKYLPIPLVGKVKMCEALRFQGKILKCTIKLENYEYYASFQVEMAQQEYERTHKINKNKMHSIGIDLGIKSFATLSNGLIIHKPKSLDKLDRLIKRRSRALERKQHPRTKDAVLQGVKKSNNFIKASVKLSALWEKQRNLRDDFLNKLSSVLVRYYSNIAIEDLKVSNMVKNHKLAHRIQNLSLYKFRTMLEYKAKLHNSHIVLADTFYPSSKTCSKCGNIKQSLKLNERTYICQACGNTIDRDYNASLNLNNLIPGVYGELTPADIKALILDLETNKISTSMVETGNTTQGV